MRASRDTREFLAALVLGTAVGLVVALLVRRGTLPVRGCGPED